MKDNIRRNQKLVGKILLMSIGSSIVMAIILLALGIVNIKEAYISSYEDELHTAAVQMDSQFSNEWDGDWGLDEEGNLTKGGQPVHDEYREQLDAMEKENDLEYTLFYCDTRMVSTLTDESGNTMEGTQASGETVEKVIKGGEDYHASGLKIAGEEFYVYYRPLKNSDGSVVGMAFTGKRAAAVNAHINKVVFLMGGVAAAIVIVIIIIGIMLYKSSAGAMLNIVDGIQQLSKGRLTFRLSDQTLNRRDELGTIADNLVQLRDKL